MFVSGLQTEIFETVYRRIVHFTISDVTQSIFNGLIDEINLFWRYSSPLKNSWYTNAEKLNCIEFN